MIKSDNAERDFLRIIKGKNMMTPDVIAYYYQSNYAIELSEGTDFDYKPIYGVTVANAVTEQPDHDLSTMFHSKKQALDYINSL